MPRGDGTGPAGLGPMTGRGLGYCAGYSRPGYATPRFGWRRGWVVDSAEVLVGVEAGAEAGDILVGVILCIKINLLQPAKRKNC